MVALSIFILGFITIIFDQLWKRGLYTRTGAYHLLQTITNLTAKDAHISKFNSEQCKLVISYIENKLKEIK